MHCDYCDRFDNTPRVVLHDPANIKNFDSIHEDIFKTLACLTCLKAMLDNGPDWTRQV